MRHETAFVVPDVALMGIGIAPVTDGQKSGVTERGAGDALSNALQPVEAKTGGKTNVISQPFVVGRGDGGAQQNTPGLLAAVPQIREVRASTAVEPRAGIVTSPVIEGQRTDSPGGPSDAGLALDAILDDSVFVSADALAQEDTESPADVGDVLPFRAIVGEDTLSDDPRADNDTNGTGDTQTPRRRSRKKTGAAVTLGTAVFFAAAACTSSGATNPPPAATASQSPGTENSGQQMDTFYQSVVGPCMPQSGAAACDASQTGDIALVNFGQPAAEAQGTAAAMKKFIREGSGGKLDPHITIVNASEQATQDLEYVTMSNVDCVDIDSNAYNSPAVIAGYDMQQQLKKDALVVSLSAINACDTGEAARADLENGRYADIFANRAGYTITEKGDVPPPPKIKNLVLGLNGAHEVFHLERQGHTGLYAGRQQDGSYSPFLLDHTSRPFNLAKYLTGGNFDEYGSPSVMGEYVPYDAQTSASGKETFSPTPYPPDVYPWQLDTFEELKAETENKPGMLHERTIGEKGLFISTKEAKQGRYGIAHLQKPVFLQANGTNDQYLFDTIAFAPTVDQGQTSVQVWLIKFDNPAYGVPQTTSVNIGTLDPTTYGPMSLAYNHQLFTVNFQPGGVEIHSISSN